MSRIFRNRHLVKCKSVRTKLIVILVFIVGLALVGFWFVNYSLLTPYYESSKEKALENTYKKVNDVLKDDTEYSGGDGDISSEGQLKLDIINQNGGMNLYVFQVSNYWGNLMYKFEYPMVTKVEQQIIEDLTQSYLFSEDDEKLGEIRSKKRRVLENNDKYCVFKVYDKRIGSHYIELFGKIDSGSYVYLRTNTQNMRESIEIFNKFILYAGCVLLFLSTFIMIIFGNSFTKPILEISDIARRMSELDFDVKYNVTSDDEIGTLGNSINILSKKLEGTISELKSANNELKKDIEKKEQIDDMRKEFLSNVSHELKTPIALIQGYAEGLLDNINDDAESREFYCEIIIDEAKKMNNMVKKLLSLNQIEFGNNQLEFERIDIVSLLKNIINSSSLLAEKKEATIEFDHDYGKIFVWGDEFMIEEVVTNYISNAINHVDFEKKIIVSLETNDSNVRIKVFNTGNQIPAEDIDKIWTKFYKVDKARTREYGGSGIGLSIVKAIMESMNQKYGVCNREDGVEFWFELDADSNKI